MTIQITRDHIARGERESCTTCPVALALRDAMPQVANWHVDDKNILHWESWYTDPIGAYLRVPARRFDTPAKVQGFLSAFDAGFNVEPISFELDIEEFN